MAPWAPVDCSSKLVLMIFCWHSVVMSLSTIILVRRTNKRMQERKITRKCTPRMRKALIKGLLNRNDRKSPYLMDLLEVKLSYSIFVHPLSILKIIMYILNVTNVNFYILSISWWGSTITSGFFRGKVDTKIVCDTKWTVLFRRMTGWTTK